MRNLKRGLVTSYLIERVTQPRIGDAPDLLHRDIATVAYAAALMDEHQESGGRLAQDGPIIFSSAAAIRGSELTLQILRCQRDGARQACLIEIASLTGRVPPSRLLEAVSLLKLLCLGVRAWVRPSLKALDAVKDCGLQGPILEPTGLRTGPEMGRRLKGFAAAHGIAPILIVHGLAGPDLISLAMKASFTHASE